MTAAQGASRGRAFAYVLVAYTAALGAAVALGFFLGDRHPVLVAGVGDFVATVVVFLFSLGFNNSSFYDPYWSVAPLPIAAYWMLHPLATEADPARPVLVVVLVALYGFRLTFNWARRWSGLHHEDWRYVNIRHRTGSAYWPASFLGIHLFPTAMVFLGCLSLVPALLTPTSPFGGLDLLAFAVTGGAIWFEAAADKQLIRFLKSGNATGKTLSTGLWAACRHPNYFGEVAFWWGLYLFGLAANPDMWWTLVGPVGMTAMFVFISVPMIDKRMLERRPDYAVRMKTTPALLPWFPRSRSRGG